MNEPQPISAPNPPVHLLAAFQHAYPEQTPEWVIRAPGRNVWIAAAPVSAEQFTISAPAHESRTCFSLRSAKTGRTVNQRPLVRWARYPAAVLLALYENLMDVIGLNIVVLSEEPTGPGYDYGLGIAFAALWHEVHAQPYTTDSLVEIVDRARRNYVEA
ncbi:MAG TPA: hypothetical protein VHO69_03620 [Phototrophicaceae bacterium]|nr:hypothetical protein [Phototrophicaceae bacterium]